VYVESGSVEVRADSLRSAPVVDERDEEPVMQSEVDTVQAAPRPAASGVRTLTAGQQATLRGGVLGLPTPAAPDAALDWTRGVLVAEALPLDQVTEELSRHFGTAVRVPPSAQRLRVSGAFELTTLRSTLDIIGEAAGGTFVGVAGNAYVFTQQQPGREQQRLREQQRSRDEGQRRRE
jgi:ferric-dicitrate binding protein FerR (iron transport regulator)